MPKGLERRYGQNHLHFITFTCYRRLPLLKSIHARNLFVETLGQLRARRDFLIVGYVVMPNTYISSWANHALELPQPWFRT
jgi:putative transposase